MIMPLFMLYMLLLMFYLGVYKKSIGYFIGIIATTLFVYNALGTKQKKFWRMFSPRGVAAVNYSLGRQSQTDKTMALAAELLDAQAEYQYFPYPLKNLQTRHQLQAHPTSPGYPLWT